MQHARLIGASLLILGFAASLFGQLGQLGLLMALPCWIVGAALFSRSFLNR